MTDENVNSLSTLVTNKMEKCLSNVSKGRLDNLITKIVNSSETSHFTIPEEPSDFLEDKRKTLSKRSQQLHKLNSSKNHSKHSKQGSHVKRNILANANSNLSTSPSPSSSSSTNDNTELNLSIAMHEDPDTELALQAHTIKRHLQGTLKEDLIPLLVQKSLIKTLTERKYSEAAQTSVNKADIVDFRDLPVQSIETDMTADTEPENASLFTPPDEFDWFSRDKFGKILSTPEACEIFNLIYVSGYASKVEHLYLNARRGNYWAAKQNTVAILWRATTALTNLTVVVLRGIADDKMLLIMGERAKNLKYIDVSGSKFVTDEGIQHLFLSKKLRAHKTASSYCLISSWVKNNLEKMNPVVNTIQHLDYSWTSVTHVARNMVNLFPGSFLYKRMLTPPPVSENEDRHFENYAYGQHIFIRNKADFQAQIPSNKSDFLKFEADLQNYAGPKGVKSFMKLLEGHVPWKNRHLTVYIEKGSPDEYTNWILEEHQTPYCQAIITPSEKENRIYGHVTFAYGSLRKLYSIYPLNVNVLGASCPKLRILRGILTDMWKMRTSLLPELRELDMFAEPSTLVSVLEYCPNLRNIRVRILREQLYDHHIAKGITNAMCKRTLEELWIAPSYKKEKFRHENRAAQKTTKKSMGTSTDFDKLETILGRYEHVAQDIVVGLEDLVQLSSASINLVVQSCPKLKRLGDIAWWSQVDQTQLPAIVKELKKVQGCNVSFISENDIVTDE